MYSPQQALKDFQSDRYATNNRTLLEPAYATLFENMYRALDLNNDIKKNVEILFNFFDQVEAVVLNKKVRENFNSNPEGSLLTLKNNLPEANIKAAVAALVAIIKFIKDQRTNINGLESLLWTLFNETAMEGLFQEYLNKAERVQEQLLSRSFLSLIVLYPSFTKISIQNILMPVELKNPSRRQGNFDALVLKAIVGGLNNFTYEPKRTEDYPQDLKNITNWGISENSVQNLGLPIPSRGKIPDMVIKIDDGLIIGAHKEQTFGGGGQDNQAEDAGRIFQFTKEQEEEYKSKLGVKNIYYSIVLDLQFASLSSKHWNTLVEIVKEEKNTNKYLISSYQLKLLIESLLTEKNNSS